MKKVYLLLAALLLTTLIWAQSPEKMSYQAVVRNSSNQLVTNQTVGIQISILQGSASGAPVYVETQTPGTNANGLISLEIGNGTVESGDFSSIDWADGPYFIKTEIDPAGESAYSITGTSQLLSVPYALHAKTAESFTGVITETDPVYSASQATNITATDITNLGNLSGVNSGDQDLSGLATNSALGDSVALIRSEIPDVNALATQTALNDSIAVVRSEIPDVSGFITTESQNLADVIALNNAAKGQIKKVRNPTDDQDAATKAYVDSLVAQKMLELQIDIGLRVQDIDGNVYRTVTIGTQVWMAENLKVTKYNDSTDIPLVTDDSEWSTLTTPGYCRYITTYETDVYGPLYNWYTVNTGDLCPTGWHVPSDAEWTTLTDYLGGIFIAGGKLKETGTLHWMSPNTGATNETGFTALPGGSREKDGTYNFMGTGGFWWTATQRNSGTGWYRYINYNTIGVNRFNTTKNIGYSVRCVKDIK